MIYMREISRKHWRSEVETMPNDIISAFFHDAKIAIKQFAVVRCALVWRLTNTRTGVNVSYLHGT